MIRKSALRTKKRAPVSLATDQLLTGFETGGWGDYTCIALSDIVAQCVRGTTTVLYRKDQVFYDQIFGDAVADALAGCPQGDIEVAFSFPTDYQIRIRAWAKR